MDLGSVRCPLPNSKGIMLGTLTTIKWHFGGNSSGAPHLILQYIYLRMWFLLLVKVPLHLNHIEPFGTLGTIKSHLAPRLKVDERVILNEIDNIKC